MATSNKYEDMSALDALQFVKNQNMLLPDIQREYVWEDWEIENLQNVMNIQGDGFRFSRDYLMRMALVLVNADTNLKIQSLTKKTILDIRTNWKSIKTALEYMAKLLANIGLSHETLTSYNATMPIAYYLYNGGKIKDDTSKKEVRKFLSVAMANRLFGVASNSALNNTRNALKSIDCKTTPFSLSLFKGVTLTGGRNFIVTKEDVEYWLEHYEKGQNTYVLLSLLYPNLKLSQVAFHQDHCHPYVGFDNKNIKALKLSAEKQADWQWKRNLLPNLQFLEGNENEHKNKTPLKDWMAENPSNDFAYHPTGISLELKDFDTFFEARRVLIKQELFKIFDLTYDATDEKKDKARPMVP